MTKVSVIIPYYNGEKEWLLQAVDSVLNQTFPNIEVIVVNDGSQNQVSSWLNLDDKRVKHMQHTSNQGIAAARNTGISVANGEFISFLDQDDYLHERKLERQLAVFNNRNEVGVVYGDVVDFGNFGSTRSSSEKIPDGRTERINTVFAGNPITTISALIRQECFTSSKLDESLYGADDWDLWLRLADEYLFRYIPQITAYKRSHESNVSSNYKQMTADELSIAQKYISKYECINRGSEKMSGILLRRALSAAREGDYITSFTSLLSAFKQSPRYSISKTSKYFLVY